MTDTPISDKKTIMIYAIGTLLIIILFGFLFLKLYDIHLSCQLNAFIKQQELLLTLAKNDLYEKLNIVIQTPFTRFDMYQEKNIQSPIAVNFFSIPEIMGVTVFDENGIKINNIVENTSWSSKEQNIRMIQDVFQDCRESLTQSEDYYVFPIVQSDDHHYLITAYPVTDNGSILYYCVTTDIRKIIADIIIPVKIGSYGSAMAIDNQGMVLYDIESGIIGQNIFDLHQSYPEVLELDREMIENASGNQIYHFLIRAVNELRRKYISWDSVNIGNQKITLAITTPEEDILGDLQRYKSIFLFLGIAIIIVEILFGILIYRLHSRNLKHTAKKLYTDYQKQSQKLIESEKKAVTANHAKSEFLANMSHEFKTPLNAILGFSELLIETEEKEENKDYLKMIKESGDQLLLIVSDILKFSQIESGKYTIDAIETNIKQLLINSAEFYRKKIEDTDLKFNLIIDKDIPVRILVDDLSLKQVINNLLSNAVKFTEKGSITLDAKLKEKSKSNAKIEFSVIDTGIGISADMTGMIFESFTQVDTSISRRYGGTGLGLAIADNILKMMKSSLKVESKKEYGSRFSFILEVVLPDDNQTF